jgi:hypothetical protein
MEWPHRPQNLICGGNAPPHRRQTRSACGGDACATPEVNPTGRANEGDDAAGMLKPQRPQNLEFCGSGVEHRGHGKLFCISPGLTRTNDRPPHLPQNFTPSAKRELQVAHATIPGIMLE